MKYLIFKANIPGNTKQINIPEKHPVIEAYFDTDVNKEEIVIGTIQRIKLINKFFQKVNSISNKSTVNILRGKVFIPPLTNKAIIKNERPINIKLSLFPKASLYIIKSV